MKPLHEDQIHNAPFIQACTHIWSDDVSRADKSGVWGYYEAISKEFNKPLVDHTNVPSHGVIFVGMCHLIESVFQSLPTTGSYIIIHRTNDRQYLPEFDAVKPKSVKHVYTVDCKGVFPNVTAIPFGNASINGEDNLVKKVATGNDDLAEGFRKHGTKLFVCFNTNPNTPHRIEAIEHLRDKLFAFVYELEYPHKQMDGGTFYKNVKYHKFTMALAGCGADASRQWAAIQLGSIPIVTDCPQMRHFEKLPLVFCPKNMEDITESWLDEQYETMIRMCETGEKSTEKMRMSFWKNDVSLRRKEFNI